MIIDDFAPISCSILSSQNVDGHTEYELECRRQYGYLGESTKTWITKKRFSDFASLDSSLHQSGSQVNLNLPKKKIVGNMGKLQKMHLSKVNFLLDRDFVVQRQKELSDFINKVLDQDQLANNINTKRFLDLESYTLNFQGIIYRKASSFIDDRRF